jgi:hypothetical protein
MADLPLEYSFPWTKEQHVRVLQAITSHAKLWIRIHSYERYLAPTALLGLGILFPIGKRGNLTPEDVVISGACFVFACCLFAWEYLMPWRQANRILPNEFGADQMVTHRLDSTGLTIQPSSERVLIAWGHLERVVETPEFFLYYRSANWAYYAPKDCVAVSDLRKLRVLVREKMGKKARLSD